VRSGSVECAVVCEGEEECSEWGEYWCWCCVNVYNKVHLLFVVLMCVCVSE
jgi:hypothetical protein